MSADVSSLDAVAGWNALVFGATGFIGRRVAHLLADHDARLTLAVRDPGRGRSLAESLPGRASVVPCNIVDDEAVKRTLELVRPAVTFNLAGYGVDRRQRDDAMAHRVNAQFPATLCAAVSAVSNAASAGACLVHAGTQLEYGLSASVAEDAEPQPDTLYGRTKLEGTLGLASCARDMAVPAVTARLFTVYGPGEPAGRLLPSLMDAAAAGTDLDMTTGTQEMDFVHVDDVAEAFVRLGLAACEPGEVINVTTGTLTSVRSFALEAARILGMPAERLRFGALPQRAETMRYDAVPPDRLRRRTGWTPSITVADGIRRTVLQRGLTHASE